MSRDKPESATLSPCASYGAVKRKVTLLRRKVSEYDAETAKLKRLAERQGGPAARFAVDMARSPAFAKLRERLRQAESDYANWKQPPRKKPDDTPLSAMIARHLARPGRAK